MKVTGLIPRKSGFISISASIPLNRIISFCIISILRIITSYMLFISFSLIPDPRFTPITTSAPILFTRSTGTGSIRPPSASVLPSSSTGTNIPGIAILALMALYKYPFLKITCLPLSRSVATIAKGLRSSSKVLPSVYFFINCSIFLPSINPFFGMEMSIHSQKSTSSASFRISPVPIPQQYSAPIMEPMLQPDTKSIGMPSSSKASMTPRWAKPRAAPDPRANPSFFLFMPVPPKVFILALPDKYI
ncbi:MAG: hypothetical protein HPY66_0202 [Firmicutes bacterium]|nr:hypothetical protein [Bacillota bacterium]